MEYKGFEIEQAYNNHIHVYKDGEMIMHMSCTSKYTEEEIKQVVDRYLDIKEREFMKCDKHCNRCNKSQMCEFGCAEEDYD